MNRATDNATHQETADIADIVIVGGGPVGQCLALAVRDIVKTGRIVIVEPNENSPDDQRSLALAESSRKYLDTLGVWKHLEADALPVRHLYVSEKGAFGVLSIHSEEERMPGLGWVVPFARLHSALRSEIERHPQITFKHAKVEEIIAVADSERERVELLAADGAHSTLHARAVAVTAGNADELIHDAPAEVTRTTADYEQSAIILSMRTERDIGDRAFERFTPEGPLAVLPGVDGQCAVVWVRTAQSIQSLGSAMDTRESEQLRAALQDDFGYRLGRILSVEKKAVYPLRMTHSTTQACRRIAILGAGAHTVHPVAAQGFNLGLRDVATLAHSLGCLRYEKESRQLTHILAQWSQARAADSSSVVRATDILARGFLRHWKILAPLRKASFLSLSLCPPWRRMLLRRYLQLGQPLNEPPLPVPDLPASK